MEYMRRKRGFNLTINLSNRWLYTLIALGIVIIFSVGVYASFGNTPNPGHPVSQLQTCSEDGKILKMSGGAWICAEDVNTDYCVGGTCGGSLTVTGGLSVSGGNIALSGGNRYIGTTSNHRLDLRTNNKIEMSITNGGSVGIGTTSPSYKLEINGDVGATGFYYTSSDRNLKENIFVLEDALSNLMKLEGVSFNWKETGKSSIGLIAQDVREVYPELVFEKENGELSVAYASLVTVLIEAVKEQQSQIEELRVEIENLRN